MENLFFVNRGKTHKKSGLLKAGLDEIMKNINSCDEDLKPVLIKSYATIFKYMDFDTFAKIKELYSNKEYPFIPNWNIYFDTHHIQIKCLKTNKDPIRLIFRDIPIGISARDEHLIVGYNSETLDPNHPSNQSLMRKPFFINLADIDHACYYKLLKYLLLTFYATSNEVHYNASKLSKAGQRAALETNYAYILFEGKRLTSIADCIKKEDDVGIKYLIEELGIKPTLPQVKMIEKIFHEDLYELVSYYFE
jgi:hypothetical protein